MSADPIAGPSCGSVHCVTCSDEGVPMRVVAPSGEGTATCEDASGRRSEVLTGLVEPVAAGDTLLVHAGAALIRLRAGEDAA